ncbi:MAG: thioredoxin family protein [Armatimonadota bacterium]
MRTTWKVLIVAVLVIAVAAVLAGKRNGVHMVPTPPSPSSREMAAQSPAPVAPQTPAAAPVAPTASPSPTPAAASPPATGARPKPAQTRKGNALPQMIELGSKTCVPCQMMQPILEELRKEYKGQLEVPFWDVYEHPEKARAYKIRVIPTQVFVDADGKELFRHEGFFPKEEILAKFKELGINLRPVS